MKLQQILNKIIASRPADWHRIRRAPIVRGPLCTHTIALHDRDCGLQSAFATDAHTDHAVLTSDVAITMAWGMTAGGDYREPWVTHCPDPSAWTGFIDIEYHRTLVHRDVYVSVDGDRCYLPLPHNLEDLRVPPDYAQLTALISALSLGCGDSDLRAYFRLTRLELADLPWPVR